jgi:two-component system, NtrC family, sensor kinase
VKLALKMILAMVTVVVLVLSASTCLRVKRLLALFDDDMRKDHVLIGSTLSVPLVEVWYRGGPERANELIRAADANQLGTHIRWLPRGELLERAPLAPLDWSRLNAIDHQQRSLAGDLMHLEASEHGSPHLVSHVPVSGSDGLLGALELITSFAARDRYIETNIWPGVRAALVLSTVAAALTMVLGFILSARPLARLTQRASARAAEDAADRARLERELPHAEQVTTVRKLAAAVAHELGTPLNIVLGRAKMIVRGKVTGPAVTESAQSIVDQAARMTSIIQRLLEQTRRSQKPEEPDQSTSSSADGVRLLRQVAALRGVELSFAIRGEADAGTEPPSLDTLTTSLVVNLLQATPPGSKVSLRARSSRAPLDTDLESTPPSSTLVRIRNGDGAPSSTHQGRAEPAVASGTQHTGLARCGNANPDGAIETAMLEVESELDSGWVSSLYLR